MKRIYAAFFNSLAGLRHGFVHETAIRQEIVLFLISIPLALFLTQDPWRLLLLWGSILAMLAVELLNTGVEQIANKITREYADEIKFAKDAGSAAVLISGVITLGIWSLSIYEWFKGF